MIAKIQGKLIYKAVSVVIIDNHGIGYEILIPLSTYYELPEVGADVGLLIYTCFRQDAIQLVGFYTEKEKHLFKLMISIAGIGPRLAVNVLSGINSDELINAIAKNDLKRLLKVPGLGKKMAERVIMELRDKISEGKPKGQESDIEDRRELIDKGLIEEDAVSALINLGYKNQAAKDAIEKVMSEHRENKSLDVILKEALKRLAI
ncbi:Holliday junction DNA helicase subunit RuvA [Syntrophus gentianae]|uniref:Holliday junction branch migration complex subunit RuvA n=1 Tax=Syntrophus gentianae TaxID=43775 RepID=A0A1H7ZJD3_9BACT|nr:Holliday junction branch migration protein RuvA [Syntrophus gentianae]SEM57547.1 Holliday junction DNA helicase subunit RuvA [Syntrophus gentianae]